MSISLAQTQQRLQSLTEISELLMSAVEPERVVAVILEAATQLFEVEGCSLALLDNAWRNGVRVMAVAQVVNFRRPGKALAGGWCRRAKAWCATMSHRTRGGVQGIDARPGTRAPTSCAAANTTRSLASSRAEHGRPSGSAPDLQFPALRGLAWLVRIPGARQGTQSWGCLAGSDAGTLPSRGNAPA
jgi:hypothetical protein